jgi:hypothetical protein
MYPIRLAALAALVAAWAPADAAAIPAFARKYGVSCQLCHAPAPKLNAFGEQFAGNGFRFAAASRTRAIRCSSWRWPFFALPWRLHRAHTEAPAATSDAVRVKILSGDDGPKSPTAATSCSAWRWGGRGRVLARQRHR